MFENYDELMQKIGKTLFERSKDLNDWIKLIVNIERPSSSSISVQAEYLTSDGTTIYTSARKLLNNQFNLFHELYQTMTADTDKHKWNRAKVTLNNNGELNIKFEWDQELEDELKRLSQEYDPRWDESLTPEEKEKKYKEMVKNGELPDLSKINITYEDKKDE